MRLSGVLFALLTFGLAGCGQLASTAASGGSTAATSSTVSQAGGGGIQAQGVPWLPGEPRPTPRPCYGGRATQAWAPPDPDRPTHPPYQPKPCGCSGYSRYETLAIGPVPDPRPTPCRP